MFKDIYEVFHETINEYDLINYGQKILIGLSGGPDSMCLLHLMRRARRKLKLILYALYIDHSIRDTREERVLISEICNRYNIPCFFEKIKLPKFTEKNAREERNKIFYRYRSKLKLDRVALAHNLKDAMETFLFRLWRGGFGENFTIMPKRDFFIHPMILISREEVISYLKEKKIPYILDITNYTERFTRNQLRHSAIPLLESMFPDWRDGFRETLRAFFESQKWQKETILKAFNTVLIEKKRDYIILNKEKMKVFPDFLNKKILNNAYFSIGGSLPLNREQRGEFLRLLNKQSGRVDLTRNFFAEISKDKVAVFQNFEGEKLSIPFREGDFPWSPLNIRIRISRNKGKSGYGVEKEVSSHLCFRTRRDGDSFHFLRGRPKKLKKFMLEAKIPRFLRDRIPLLARGNKILWVYPDFISQEMSNFSSHFYFFEVTDEEKNSN